MTVANKIGSFSILELLTRTHSNNGTKVSWTSTKIFGFKRASILPSLDIIVSLQKKPRFTNFGNG